MARRADYFRGKAAEKAAQVGAEREALEAALFTASEEAAAAPAST